MEIEAQLDDLSALLTENAAKAALLTAELDETAREQKKQLEEMRNTLRGASDAKEAASDALRQTRLDEFMSGFNVISLRLKEMYQMITLGGDAELELVDSLDPFSEGIVFSVRPPKKSWKLSLIHI